MKQKGIVRDVASVLFIITGLAALNVLITSVLSLINDGWTERVGYGLLGFIGLCILGLATILFARKFSN